MTKVVEEAPGTASSQWNPGPGVTTTADVSVAGRCSKEGRYVRKKTTAEGERGPMTKGRWEWADAVVNGRPV